MSHPTLKTIIQNKQQPDSYCNFTTNKNTQKHVLLYKMLLFINIEMVNNNNHIYR